MPEYRRFISYFYEYIDGKKQRNTGFAKVELRNGVWRVLFRLTVPVQPEPPVEVFGFIREGEELTGFPMGTMRAAREMTEEWAYRADRPVWAGKYGLSDISGLWIQSEDGRCFATVWDDEPVDPVQFVRYGTQNEEPAGNMENMPEGKGEISGQSKVLEFSGNEGEMLKQSEDCGDSENVPEQPDNAGKMSELSESRESAFKQLKDMGNTSELMEENRETDAEWHQKENLTGQETEADLGPGNDEAESKIELEKDRAESPKMPQMISSEVVTIDGEAPDIQQRKSSEAVKTDGETPDIQQRISSEAVKTDGEAPDIQQRISSEVVETGEESPGVPQKMSAEPKRTETELNLGDDEKNLQGSESSALKPEEIGKDISEPVKGEENRLRGTSAPENKNTEDEGSWMEEAAVKSGKQGGRNPEDDRLWRDLYRKRAAFQPFSDQEISSCIRVVPGDIVVLQNAHWRTGRNNFLLHGYHNYRHLLIGKGPDGGYVLGVPGIMNPQEKYMAAMFGFPDFKYADDQEGNPSFGYWYRPLKKEDQ